MTRGWVILLILAFIDLAVIVYIQTKPSPVRTERTLFTTPFFASSCYSRYAVPPGCIFGLSGVRGVILSSYGNEASLLGWREPVGDYDYLLSWGQQESIKLPGGSWNHYPYYGSVYIWGSGCVLEYGTPNGGRFAFLHMSQTSFGCGTTAPLTGGIPTPDPLVHRFFSGDEFTASRAQLFLSPSRGSLFTIPGGHRVGWSRWPDSYLYGNGSCCQADAHLCVVLDLTARNWFNHIAMGQDRPPWHFNYHRWNYWRVHHGKSRISPWSGCKGKQSCLIWPAAVFDRHQRMGGLKDLGHWYPPSKNQYGYMKYPYVHADAFCWPHYHTCKRVYH